MTVKSAVPRPGSSEEIFLDRICLPKPLFWGFGAILIFMIGDGIETNYLAPYLADNGLNAQLVGTAITIYGVTVASGTVVSLQTSSTLSLWHRQDDLGFPQAETVCSQSRREIS